MRTSTLFTLTGIFAAAFALPSPTPKQPNLNAIKSINSTRFQNYKKGGLVRAPLILPKHSRDLETRDSCPSSSQFSWGDNDNGGPGLVVTNGASDWMGFYVYENSCDTMPLKHFWLSPGSTEFISLPSGFQGRVTRGTDAMNLGGQPQLLGYG